MDLCVGDRKDMIAQFPYPTNTHTLTLPNPDLGDTIRNESGITIKRSMLNTRKTAIIRTNNNVRNYVFQLTQLKALELLHYYMTHAADKWVLDGEVGYIKINPLEFNFTKRGATTVSNDVATVTIEFEVL